MARDMEGYDNVRGPIRSPGGGMSAAAIFYVKSMGEIA